MRIPWGKISRDPGNGRTASAGTFSAAATCDASMRMLATDESLSEETRESAQQALDELVSAQVERDKEAHAELQKLESEAQFSCRQAEAKARKEMMEWLAGQRLSQHAADVARVAGANATPSDLQFLTDEEADELGSSMTRVEKVRLEAALQTLREEQPVTVASE